MGFPTQTDSAEAPFPHSTPETAEFLGEDLLQVRAWAGWAGRQVRAGCQYRGWQARTAVKGLVVSFLAGQGRRGLRGEWGKGVLVLGETTEQ